MKSLNDQPQGFTLLELLIVIAIIAIIAALLVWVLNPAETLRKGRDSQRISDLKTLNQALAFYLTVVSNPDLDGSVIFQECEDSREAPDSGRIWTSVPDPGVIVLDCSPGMSDPKSDLNSSQPCLFGGATPNNIDGTGWIPVNFTVIPGGSPISHLPIDPVNKLKKTAGVLQFSHIPSAEYNSNDGYYYRYTCKKGDNLPPWKCGALTWEIDANLESNEFRPKEKTDGGDWEYLYEIGTCLYLLRIGELF